MNIPPVGSVNRHKAIDRLIRLIDDHEQDCRDWESRFHESVWTQFREKGDLSELQVQKLKEILDRLDAAQDAERE
jgi:hypothetical protein